MNILRFWILAAGLFAVYALAEQRLLLIKKRRIVLPDYPCDKPLTILHISDIHHKRLGHDNARLSKQALKYRPDLIVITGDLVSRDVRDFRSTGVFLRRLRAVAPVYLVPGNHELDMPPTVYHALKQVVRQSGCRMLENETVNLPGGVFLAGARLWIGLYRGARRSYRHLDTLTPQDLKRDLGSAPGCTILLAHNPLFFDAYAAWGASLILAGHMHGGAVRLPFVGGILSPERRFFPRYSKGLYQKDGAQMLVSGGVGKIRLFNPPEVYLLMIGRN